MGRIMAIDYGQKRTGLAVTDPLCIIATALTTVQTDVLFAYLTNYFTGEQVDEVIVGMPKRLNNQVSDQAIYVQQFVQQFKAQFSDIPITLWDERFTSVLAKRTLIDSSVTKKKRRKKTLVDQISATLMLQEYLTMRTRK